MNPASDISEISAEMLLEYLYPELSDKWVAHHEGTFFRNYNNDALEISPATAEAFLARDGFLNLLPQGYISPENELKVKNKQEKLKEIEQRKKLLKAAFLPIDAFNFRKRLKIERVTSDLLNKKIEYILRVYFGIELEKLENYYIREMAMMLPFVRKWRGDFGLIKSLMSSIFECDVNLFVGRYSHSDSTVAWLPYLRFELMINDLDSEGFIKLMEGIAPFSSFLAEWFLPAEIYLDIEVKSDIQNSRLQPPLILGYNSEITI